MSYKELKREDLETYFVALANSLKKKTKVKNFSYELIIVGGASIILNYSFRESTIDIDCLDMQEALMNETVNEVGEKYKLPNGWINTDFVKTDSYSPVLIQYSTFYKTYGNGILTVRTIKDEYLVAMKLKSARRYKHDYSDIVGIVLANIENKQFTFESVITAFKKLYGNTDCIKNEALLFLRDVFSNKATNYKEITELENKNKELLVSMKKSEKIDEKTLDEILKGLNDKR